MLVHLMTKHSSALPSFISSLTYAFHVGTNFVRLFIVDEKPCCVPASVFGQVGTPDLPPVWQDATTTLKKAAVLFSMSHCLRQTASRA